MVFEPRLFDYIEGDESILEKSVLNALVEEGQLAGYTHKGYWQCMDTLREKNEIEHQWQTGNAPWKLWEN